MPTLPSGTVTFLFTDIEGSTRLLQELGEEQYGQLLAAQRRLLRAAFEKHGGQEVDTQGDAFFVSFSRASQAVAAAVEAQHNLVAHPWPQDVEVRVRMGLHTGEPLVAGEGYVGMAVHRAARIAHVGHGGQVLLSPTTTELVRGDLPEGVGLRALGAYRLKDLQQPEPLSQLEIEGLPADFPPLKARQVRPPAEPGPGAPARLPAFLQAGAAEPVPRPAFVAREGELAQMDRILQEALSGQGKVVLLTGGAGRGKTALMDAFIHQALLAHPGLLAASGQCNAYTGAGDPYLPFRDVLAVLTGDVESRWQAGAISREGARRAWESLPAVVQALVAHGPDLVDVFLPGRPLLARAQVAAPGAGWLAGLRDLVEGDLGAASLLDQAGLFGQVEAVLRTVAAERPLLLTLDDLQWADAASLNLLFHLGRRLAGTQVLILAAYRPEEVALGRDGERHPLEKLLGEFKRQYGEAGIDLGETVAGDRAFVDALLDTEPHRLSAAFREALFQHTQGHPLFTVELLRALQGRGDLLHDGDGHWIEGSDLDWGTLPARVEGVIEERIGRLEEQLRDILTVASVEGESFTAQVVARVQALRERGLVRQLSRELDRRHRLVAEQGQRQVGPLSLYLYRFRHSLFQKHLYNGLSGHERRLLHAEVGAVLEALYGEEAGEIAPQLAWHFAEAGESARAVKYLLQAGDRARWRFAHEEAIRHYRQAAAILQGQEEFQRAGHTLIKLGQTYHDAGDFQQAHAAYQEGFSVWEQAGKVPSSAAVLQAPHPFRIAWEFSGPVDPNFAYADHQFAILKQVFSGLVELSPTGDMVPAVAHAWEVREDGREYIFHLREDACWSEGVPLTTGDFTFAWERNRDRRLAFDFQAPDDLTLVVRPAQPSSFFLYFFNIPNYFAVPRHVVQRYGEEWIRPEHLVSNGPFIVETYIPEEKLTLVRNPHYVGPYAGNVHQVEIRYVEKDKERLGLYQADRLDMMLFLDHGTLLPRHWTGELMVLPRLATYWLNINSQQEPFQDPRVRQALAMAVDKERLISELHNGQDVPAAGGLLPPHLPGHAPDIGLPFDPQGARRLLSLAGFPDGRGFPDFTLGVTEFRIPHGQYLCDQWRENLGVEIDLQTFVLGGFTSPIPKNMFLRGWHADIPDPIDFLDHALIAIRNWFPEGYLDQVAQAQRVIDRQDRMALYHQAERQLVGQAHVIPLFYSRTPWLVKPWVRFYRPPFSLTEHFIYFRDIILEPHD